jgi:hypothetical protein
MAAPARLTRQKISTTISSATLSYLEQSIRQGEAKTLAEAIDLAVRQLLVYENRERLANDTAAYFERMSPQESEAEAGLGAALANSVKGVDFDREP